MRNPWIVVLAGGDGVRLASLTRALYGTELPKQYAVLVGERSLLQQTVERALRLTIAEQVLVVVSSSHEAIARAQLADYAGVDLVVQPRNLDTGPGLLLPLARILAADPGARVGFLPSDHYFSDDTELLAVLRNALAGDRITLLGATATAPETEYGWIVSGRALDRGTFQITQFREKPSLEVAEELFRAGARWNTFISAGPARRFWYLARRHLPIHTARLGGWARAIGTSSERRELEHTYAAMPAANFSREVLARSRDLAVAPISAASWSDWGSPQRVFASLAGSRELDRLLARIRDDRARPDVMQPMAQALL
jgi:mannose-1-phosphate guanylyltransferase